MNPIELINKLFGNQSNLEQQLHNVKNNMAMNNQNPQAMVQQMLDSGKMSQDQFNKCREVVNSILGTRN